MSLTVADLAPSGGNGRLTAVGGVAVGLHGQLGRLDILCDIRKEL